MKRLFPFFLHFFILFLFFLSLVILHFAPKGSDTIAFLKEKDYLPPSTVRFRRALTISSITLICETFLKLEEHWI